MDELAAKQVLLDFEIIILIALAVGVAVFALVRRFSGPNEEKVPSDFDGYDLALMVFPALLFLINPLLEVFVSASEAVEVEESATNGIRSMMVNLVYFLFVGLMTFGIIEWIRNRRVVDLFGLRRLSLPTIVVYTILGGVASLVICAWALGDVSQVFLDGVFTDLASQDTVEELQQSESSLHLILSVIMACVAAPLVEELLFRGYMYGAVKKATNPLFASVIIGGLFSVVHGNLPALIPLWAFSIMLCCAYEWTRCLWVPIGMHAFFNAANIILMRVPEHME